jgi:hypothetical protein
VLVRQPSAVVWHRHRRSVEELGRQIEDYGRGLGAWIFKLLTRPTTLGIVLRKMRTGIRHLRSVTVVEQRCESHDPALNDLHRREFRAVFRGPAAMLRSRVSGRRAEPLRSPEAQDATEDGPNEPRQSARAARLSVAGVVLGLIGALGAVQSLPTAVLTIVVVAFLLAGPGAVVLSWYPHLPASVLAALVPVVSLAVCVLVVTVLLMFGIYRPTVVLLAMTATTALVGVMRARYLADRGNSAEAPPESAQQAVVAR